jgi:hypothetical protein
MFSKKSPFNKYLNFEENFTTLVIQTLHIFENRCLNSLTTLKENTIWRKSEFGRTLLTSHSNQNYLKKFISQSFKINDENGYVQFSQETSRNIMARNCNFFLTKHLKNPHKASFFDKEIGVSIFNPRKIKRTETCVITSQHEQKLFMFDDKQIVLKDYSTIPFGYKVKNFWMRKWGCCGSVNYWTNVWCWKKLR